MTDLPLNEDAKRDKEAMEHATPYGKVVNPLDGLPDWVKHPKNYEKIQRALLETLTCGKLHSDPAQSLHCAKCTQNMVERRKLMQKFGFKNAAQYMAWRKTHEEIKNKVPLEMYNRLINEDKTTLEK